MRPELDWTVPSFSSGTSMVATLAASPAWVTTPLAVFRNDHGELPKQHWTVAASAMSMVAWLVILAALPVDREPSIRSVPRLVKLLSRVLEASPSADTMPPAAILREPDAGPRHVPPVHCRVAPLGTFIAPLSNPPSSVTAPGPARVAVDSVR